MATEEPYIHLTALGTNWTQHSGTGLREATHTMICLNPLWKFPCAETNRASRPHTMNTLAGFNHDNLGLTVWLESDYDIQLALTEWISVSESRSHQFPLCISHCGKGWRYDWQGNTGHMTKWNAHLFLHFPKEAKLMSFKHQKRCSPSYHVYNTEVRQVLTLA